MGEVTISEKDGLHGKRLTVADRVGTLMKHLGLSAAHFGTSAPMELASFISADPDALSSLTLLNSSRFPTNTLSAIADRMLVFSGDSGLAGEAMQQAKPFLSDAWIVEFPDYPAVAWTDMAADHADRIATSMLEFLAHQEAQRPATQLHGVEPRGTVAGLTYDISGEGPTILLFPAMLAPSQWTPLIDRLAAHFAVIRLGGPHLGVVAILEDRGSSQSYRRVLRGMLHDANVGATDRLLEVGCGSGVISRWLARERLCALPITALDLNPFLLNEAEELAQSEGLRDAIKFEQGNAEALPFPDNSFDVVLSVTVIEECDATKAIGEMVRVVKPGGRIAIQVRACDMHVLWNLPVDPEIKAKAEAPISQVAPAGCADASLMQRLLSAGLERVIAYPTFHGSKAMRAYYEPIALSQLNEEERELWHAAKSLARADGTFYMMHPAHCAIGVKPQ